MAWGGQNMGITLSNVVLTNNQFHTYPNPVVDELYIQSETKVNGVKIYNLVGKFLRKIKHIDNNKIEIGDLDSGIYILHIDSYNHSFQN